MSKLVLAQGAEHIDHDKLVGIINDMSNTRISISSNEYNRVMDVYKVNLFRLPCATMPYIAEIKKDGYSYICDNSRFFSRKLSEAKGNEGAPIEKTTHVPHLNTLFSRITQYVDIDIHGELYIPGGTSDDVTRIMGCAADKAVDRQKKTGWLHYMIHDIRRYNGVSLVNEPWYVRRAILERIWYLFFAGTSIEDFVDLSNIYDNPVGIFNTVVSAGGEGIVLKNTRALYIPGGKPANNWIKCKKEITLDVVVMGYNNDGSGKNAGLFKSVQVGLMIDGKLTYVGNIHSGISDKLRYEMHNDRDRYINRIMEVDAMELYHGNNLRHGRFIKWRDDKSIDQCTTNGVRVKVDLL